jgi:gamma-tubulin complex component 2
LLSRHSSCKPSISSPNGAIMSSSNARVSSYTERRTTNDNGTARPRAPSAQQGGSKNDRSDGRRTQSPQPQQSSTSGTSHRRNASNSQRMKGGVEERRTERVQVTTRETLSSRTRSPERRTGPPTQPQERARPSEVSRADSGDRRSRSSKAEPLQGRHLL